MRYIFIFILSRRGLERGITARVVDIIVTVYVRVTFTRRSYCVTRMIYSGDRSCALHTSRYAAGYSRTGSRWLGVPEDPLYARHNGTRPNPRPGFRDRHTGMCSVISNNNIVTVHFIVVRAQKNN